jgi:hypothetical protein
MGLLAFGPRTAQENSKLEKFSKNMKKMLDERG